MESSRRERVRAKWLETITRHQADLTAPGSENHWSPKYDRVGRDELVDIQNDKLAALTPFLYETSEFYRRRFDRLGLAPTDIQTVDDLPRWPVIDKTEMMEDVVSNPPFGTYSTMDDEVWRTRGWMQFSSSGSTGVPRVFRYSHIDRELWAWASARAMYAFGMRHTDTVFVCSGYGPHVYAWGVQTALAKMNVAVIPGGGMDSNMRAMIVERFQPTVICSTPSYALHLGRVMEQAGLDPARSAVRLVFVGGEPATGISNTRRRLEDLWGAKLVEFYGCTEAAPHAGGFSCTASDLGDGPVTTHLLEDVQIWELVDDESKETVATGERGLTVCTNLNSESSPQLRFLVGDYATFNTDVCDCGRTHVRAMGGFCGRSDDLINLRGIKMYPVQLEEAVRAVPGIGDEYEIVLDTNPDGLDIMTARVEHTDPSVGDQVMTEIRARCEIRADVEVLAPGTLPTTEFKARRVRDERKP